MGSINSKRSSPSTIILYDYSSEARSPDALHDRLDAYVKLIKEHGEPVENLIAIPFEDGNSE